MSDAAALVRVRYGTVDVDRLWTDSPAGVAALREYADAMAGCLDRTPQGDE